ncbi:OSBPL1A [Bugula neritina]|uniref:OSBPL1A n=1 Tax=Bugula neritina TaxID=10212 RepID=A0A7J7J6A6_BUGNE|nr:OSBPL1A [Bugula neritina]
MASDTENLSDDTEDLPAEEKFLAFSRNGQTSQIKDFLVSRDDTSLLVNCKGTSKANRDWSPLHLSSYFGHTSTADFL